MLRLHELLTFCCLLTSVPGSAISTQEAAVGDEVTRSIGAVDMEGETHGLEVQGDESVAQETVSPSVVVRTSSPSQPVRREEAARVPQPAVLNAFHAFEGESALMRSSVRTKPPPVASEERCQYVFSVPTGPQCSSTLIEAKVAELYDAFMGLEAKLEGQRNRLEAAETFIRRFNRALATERFFSSSSSESGDREAISARGFLPPVLEEVEDEEEELGAADALLDFADQMNAQLLRLQRRVKGVEAERTALLVQNRNLTETLRNASLKLDAASTSERELQEDAFRYRADLTLAMRENEELRESQRSLMNEKQRLSDANALLSQRALYLSEENKGIRATIQTQRDEIERLLTDKDTWENRHINASRRIQQLERALADLRQLNGSSTSAPSCDDRAEEEVDDGQDYTQCGRLVSLSEPQTVGESTSSLGRYGVWMRDPLGDSSKIWMINLIYTRSPKLLEFANVRRFRDRKPTTMRRLHVPLENTGAVIFNGSLYYQRKNSRKIVRYDLRSKRSVRQRVVKNAGFHGMFAYQYGAYSDIDLAVDETGIWVIYSTRENKGNIVISRMDPVTLRISRPIRTKISKLSVANAFIICQTLYTVSAYNLPNAKINFAVDLNTRKTTKPNIPFINTYRHTVMIDYNPRDRYLYTWDNGRQVRYKAILDTSLGPVAPDSDTTARAADP